MTYDKPIPHREFPNHNVKYEVSFEPLIAFEEFAVHQKDRIVYSPVYFDLGLPGAVNQCCLRKGTAIKLLNALELLPMQYGFKIFDAWRPFELQLSLYNAYKETVVKNNPDKTSEEIDFLVNKYVSIPANDPQKPPVHTTGGAVDLTIINLDSHQELDMGTDFDYFGEKASSDYFERLDDISSSEYDKIRLNRRLLYNTMIYAGFSNLPSEWWHYDYGNAYWASSFHKNALYQGIFA